MLPESMSKKRGIRLSIVDFPAPDGPTSATVWPAGIVSETPSIAAVPGSNLIQPPPERSAVLHAGQKAISKSKPIIKPVPKVQTVKNSAPEVSRPDARAANNNAHRNAATTPSAMSSAGISPPGRQLTSRQSWGC